MVPDEKFDFELVHKSAIVLRQTQRWWSLCFPAAAWPRSTSGTLSLSHRQDPPPWGEVGRRTPGSPSIPDTVSVLSKSYPDSPTLASKCDFHEHVAHFVCVPPELRRTGSEQGLKDSSRSRLSRILQRAHPGSEDSRLRGWI